MTPQHPARMPLREKVLLGTLAAVTAVCAALLASPDADANPTPTPTPGVPQSLDPIELVLGPQPVTVCAPADLAELMLGRDRPTGSR